MGAIVAIKFKLVLIFLAIVASVVYGFKLYTGGSSCPTPVISEHGGPSFLPFEGYSSSVPGIYSSSYPGADPYSGYSEHPGIPSAVGAEVAPTSAGPYRRTSSIKKRSADQPSSSSSPRWVGCTD